MRVLLYLYFTSMCIPAVQNLEITTNAKEVFAEGSEALLNCTYTPTNALGVDITWTRYKTQDDSENLVVRNTIQNEYKARMELEVSSNFEGKGGLKIYEVSKEDAMVYVCNIYSTSGSDIEVTTLDVQWNYKPKITSEASKLTLQVGDNVTASCTPNGHPTPVVSWLIDNQTIQMDERFAVDENTLFLHIVGVTRNDHALLISCSTQNAVNVMTSDQIELDIQYKPEVYLNQIDNIIQCISQANPVAYLTEFQINDVEPEKSNNNVYELTGSECVNITCFVTNSLGMEKASDSVCPVYIPPTYQLTTDIPSTYQESTDIPPTYLQSTGSTVPQKSSGSNAGLLARLTFPGFFLGIILSS